MPNAGAEGLACAGLKECVDVFGILSLELDGPAGLARKIKSYLDGVN
jgi:hypothetical protein